MSTLNNKNLRRMMYLKRIALSALGNSPGRVTSLAREENLVEVQAEVLSVYSPGKLQEIFDPRSKLVRGHYFQERKVVRIYDVIVETKQGVVYSQDGKLLRESTCWPPFQFYNSFPWNPGSNYLELKVDDAVILSSSSYGHWLLEDLPSTIDILAKHPHAVILVAANPPKYVRDYLSRVDNEVIFLNSPVRVRSLIMIEKSEDSGWPHPQDVITLQNFGSKITSSKEAEDSIQVYASRRKSKRSPANEAEIEKVFSSFGFQVHCLEDFNFYEEINLISNCTYLAGIHGSALMNSVWMSAKSTVYEIVNDSYWTEYGHRLPKIAGHTYKYSTYPGKNTDEVPLGSIRKQLE